jgi:hypothetical protein
MFKAVFFCSTTWMIRFIYMRNADCSILSKNYLLVVPSKLHIWTLVREVEARDDIKSLLNVKAPGTLFVPYVKFKTGKIGMVHPDCTIEEYLHDLATVYMLEPALDYEDIDYTEMVVAEHGASRHADYTSDSDSNDSSW